MQNLAYARPQTLNEALDFLDANGADTKILAGGTDVMVDLRTGEIQPQYLLDVSRLAELKGIEVNDQGLSIGAGVTLAEIYDSKTLARFAPSLQKCAFTFASQQIRNVATIGGNVAHCSPCGDTIPPLVIHEARAVLAGKNGLREVPIADIASGPYVCALPVGEIILRFILKPAEDGFADFQKIGRRQALAIARISMAVMARKDPDGKIAFMRFCLGSCTPTPRRMKVVEDFLIDTVPSEALIWEAGRILAEKMIEVTGRRSSAVYKEPAIQGLFMRMLYPMV